MGTEALPVEIVIVDDDNDADDDLSVLYSTSQRINMRRGTHKNNAISVENYHQSMEDRDFCIAIMASTSISSRGRKIRRSSIDLSREIEYPDDDTADIQILNRKPSITEPGESSNSKSMYDDNDDNDDTVSALFMCEICMEPKPHSETFRIKGCTHSYCSDCIHKYVASKLQDNITQIPCPVSGCTGRLEPEHCRSILPPQVFDRWGDALCEAMILASHKFYCPFKDCSALLIDDDGINGIMQSECPACWRLFCAQCKVPWHSGIECWEFQKLHKDERESDDIMLMELAKNKHWTRCPKCRFYVEKSDGCLFMRCRCGYTFCYNCGAPLKDHYCTVCKH